MIFAQFTNFFNYERQYQIGDTVQAVISSRDPKINGVWKATISKINKKTIEISIRFKENGGFLARVKKDSEILNYELFTYEGEE